MKHKWMQVVPVVVLVALSLAPRPRARAQSSPVDHWNTEVISSHALGKRTVYVSTPDGYQGSTSRYPVVVMLDGNDLPELRLLIAEAGYLANNSNGFPRLIVVGVANGPDRIYDMTPPATGHSIGLFKATGGDSAYAAFIIDEVLPLVRSKYRTLPSTVLVGHSAGGLFSLSIAARKPGVFQGIMAISPALWYNDSSLVVTYSDGIAKSPAAQRLFVSSGGLEHDIDVTSSRFAMRLDSLTHGRAAFRYRRYPEDSHSLTPMDGFGDGLRFVFDPVLSNHLPIAQLDFPQLDVATLEAALHSSERVYADAAASLGLPGALPEDVLNTLGYRLLGRNKTDLAIAVFKRNVSLYPESVNVYDSMGDGLLAAGDTASAVENFKKSVAVAHRRGATVPGETQSKLDALTKGK